MKRLYIRDYTVVVKKCAIFCCMSMHLIDMCHISVCKYAAGRVVCQTGGQKGVLKICTGMCQNNTVVCMNSVSYSTFLLTCKSVLI